MNASQEISEQRRRRLELARQAFKEFYAQCFWSSDPEHAVVEEDLPWIIRNLRQNGGHRGYRMVAELCRCLYLDATGKPVCPDPDSPGFPKLTRHYGSLKGAWPRVVES